MIELRYVHVAGSDHGHLQYRCQREIGDILRGKWGEWSNWKFVPGIVVDQAEFEKLQKESEE